MKTIQFVEIPTELLNESFKIINVYTNIVCNKYKTKKDIKINYDVLAKQCDIVEKHLKTHIKYLQEKGFLTIEETTKCNGKKGAAIFTIKGSKNWVVVPLEIIKTDILNAGEKALYLRLKHIINLKDFTTFRNYDQLAESKDPNDKKDTLLTSKRKVYDFINKLCNTEINGTKLLVNESNNKDFKFVLQYEKEVFNHNKKAKNVRDVNDQLQTRKQQQIGVMENGIVNNI
jgi:hypothetical protein